MKPNLFISYSRREVSFVDDLAGRLEQEQYNVWLDYRSLVPGRPWEEQIYQGIMNANVALLVVSKASIASQNVEVEWKRVLRDGMRIILVIFEAVELPKELANFEWVDFRGDYGTALHELYQKLESPKPVEQPAPPQSGFKAPALVWVAMVLSAIVAVMSIGALWTVFIPFFLFPLPYRIFKRSFPYMVVQGSLFMLPFALYLTTLFTTNDTTLTVTDFLMYASIPFVIAMLLILRSATMQRWGKPEAAKAVYAKHWNAADYPDPQLVPFFVEHAPQDLVVAEEMAKAFKSLGHEQATDIHAARSVFTLVSAFKNDSEVNSEKQVVYPVILQTNKQISRQLSKVQWLDFRLGVRYLDVVGKLLPEPQKLLKALCIRPMGDQMVLPPSVMYLVYYIAFLAIVCIGSWFPYFLQYFPEVVNFSDPNFVSVYPDFIMVYIQLAISLILFGVISYFMARQLVARKGPAASFLGLIVGMLLLGAIIYWQIQIDISVFEILNITVDTRGISSFYPEYLYLGGSLILAIYLFIQRADLRRWFPAKAK